MGTDHPEDKKAGHIPEGDMSLQRNTAARTATKVNSKRGKIADADILAGEQELALKRLIDGGRLENFEKVRDFKLNYPSSSEIFNIIHRSLDLYIRDNYNSIEKDVTGYENLISPNEDEISESFFDQINALINSTVKNLNLIAATHSKNPREIIDTFRVGLEEVLTPKLPARPEREYVPRENVIDYIRSPEGLGPWLEAGELTRPLIKRLSPKAYIALKNWLTNPKHSLAGVELNIPTKQEVVAERQSDPDKVREAVRVGRAGYRVKPKIRVPL